MDTQPPRILDDLVRAAFHRYVDPSIRTELRNLKRQLTRIGVTMSAVSDMVTALNTATNKLRDKLAALQAKVDGLDPAVAAQFQPILDELTALGADPANPIPEPPADVTPPADIAPPQ